MAIRSRLICPDLCFGWNFGHGLPDTALMIKRLTVLIASLTAMLCLASPPQGRRRARRDGSWNGETLRL